MKIKLLFIILTSLLFSSLTYAQVKIGENPSVINRNSILELESSSKVLVITRMSDVQMNKVKPLEGALVYNTDAKCVFAYDGFQWKSLCGASSNVKVTTSSNAPLTNTIGDFWINDTQNNNASIWNGTKWVKIDNNPRRGVGLPSLLTAPNPISGDVYVDKETGIVYAYNGTSWVKPSSGTINNNSSRGIKVTTSPNAPTTNKAGDFWIDDSKNNKTSIWSGSEWIAIDSNPRRGTGAPSSTTATNPLAGDIYVDDSTGLIYAYNGSAWVQNGGSVAANNGLSLDNNTVQLGGELIKPTVITASPTNTLAIKGLAQGNLNDDEVLTVNRVTGKVRKVVLTTNSPFTLREEVTKLVATFNGQHVFNSGFTLMSQDKVNVYRNGARIDDIIVDLANQKITITDPEARCYTGDEIRIVQFY